LSFASAFLFERLLNPNTIAFVSLLSQLRALLRVTVLFVV
jgi:hypothetical protein